MGNLLTGKNVLITGAGANIGRAIALEMALEGAHIFFVEMDAGRCAALEQELSSSGATARGFNFDSSQISLAEEMMENLARDGVAIDILVNNVGVTVSYPETTSQSFGLWQKAIDTNVLAPLYLSRLVAQAMIRSGTAGSILFITSIHASLYFGDQVYSATKASLGMIINELAVSLAPHGIRVNGIAPGPTDENDDGTAIPHRSIPLRHEQVKPCYIGRAAVVLASDYFSYCTTGATLTVDGGLSLYAFSNRHLMDLPPQPEPRLRSLRRKLHKVSRAVGRKLS